MKSLSICFEQNRQWAKEIKERDRDFFTRLAKQQAPHYLWIGCSDSRVPANQIVGLLPGDVFVHRNIANQVIHTDLNCLSVIQYAVENLKIKHIIVCGHYGCGGVKAALEKSRHGLIDNWLCHIRDVYRLHRDELDALSEQDRLSRLCELNIIEQVDNLCHTTIVQNAWSNGVELHVHGWIYAIENGILKDLDVTVSGFESLEELPSSLNGKIDS